MVFSVIDEATRGKSRFLTLEYAFASGAAVLSSKLAVEAVAACFILWNGSLVSIGMPISMLFNVTNGYVAAVTLGLAATLLALVSHLLFARVTRGVAERTDYTSRRSYKLITYGSLALVGVVGLLLVIELISIMLTSLVLIGSESSIASLYLEQFLPQVLALTLISVVGYFFYKITIGRNVSRALSQMLLGVSVGILLTLVVTVAIRSHDGYTSNDYGRVRQSVDTNDFGQPTFDEWYWNN